MVYTGRSWVELEKKTPLECNVLVASDTYYHLLEFEVI